MNSVLVTLDRQFDEVLNMAYFSATQNALRSTTGLGDPFEEAVGKAAVVAVWNNLLEAQDDHSGRIPSTPTLKQTTDSSIPLYTQIGNVLLGIFISLPSTAGNPEN